MFPTEKFRIFRKPSRIISRQSKFRKYSSHRNIGYFGNPLEIQSKFRKFSAYGFPPKISDISETLSEIYNRNFGNLVPRVALNPHFAAPTSPSIYKQPGRRRRWATATATASSASPSTSAPTPAPDRTTRIHGAAASEEEGYRPDHRRGLGHTRPLLDAQPIPNEGWNLECDAWNLWIDKSWTWICVLRLGRPAPRQWEVTDGRRGGVSGSIAAGDDEDDGEERKGLCGPAGVAVPAVTDIKRVCR